MKNILFLFCLSMSLISCQNSTAPTDTVSAKIESSQLIISNSTNKEVYYFYSEQNRLSYIDWAAFCREDNLIQASTTKKITITDSTFLPSNVAVIYWWHQGKKIEGTTTYGADSLRTIILSTK